VAVEIERKFLVSSPDAIPEASEVRPIAQGYLAVTDDTEVRVRRLGEEAFLTVKRGHGEVRREEEVELSAEQFDALWPLTEGWRLEKRRHYVEHDGLTFEVDVFGGTLEGLVVAEVEFPSEEESSRFAAPEWLGEELTGDGRYESQSLALHGRPDE
jgi:CYTH domain-containing protein